MRKYICIGLLFVGLIKADSVLAQTLHPDFYYAADEFTLFLIDFTDLSTPAAQITAWTWNFGDGTPDVVQQNPSHKFGLAGDYTVRLTINRGTEQSSVSKTISIHYTADFDWTKAVYANVPVHFTDKTIYPCPNGTTQTWSCDNLPTYTSPSADFVFPNSGTYNVKLCVTDNCGNSFCGTKSVTVINPIIDLIPGFTPSALVVAKGQSLVFTDTSTPGPSGQPIAWWAWWFEQPSDLTSENPVQNNESILFYKPTANVTHTYNKAGRFKVRLYIGNSVTYDPSDTKKEYPLAGDASVYFELVIQVKDTPELTPGFTENENSAIIGSALSTNLYAVLKSTDASSFITPQYISIYKKIGDNDSKVWEPKEYYVKNVEDKRVIDMKIGQDKIFIQLQPIDRSDVSQKFMYAITDAGTVTISRNSPLWVPHSSSLPDLIDAPFADIPNFNVFENEMVIAQKELGGGFYIYEVKKGTSRYWSNSTVIKHKISDDFGLSGKIFIDGNAIVAQVGFNKIYIIEKQNGSWDFSNKKVITVSTPTSNPNLAFSYADNTVITVTRPTDCPGLTSSVANVYERPPMGWPATTTIPTASLSLSLDTDISANTKICFPTISMSEKYVVIKVDLTNGSSTFNRTYVYKKLHGSWVFSNQMLKVKNSESNLLTENTNYDVINCFVNGKVEIYNFANYCLLNPLVQRSFSISGAQYDVVNGSIIFGDANYTGSAPIAVINPNAKISYLGTSISLLPGFTAKSGSTVSIKAYDSCDDLYNR